MIETFQAITLFGTGDPKQMAGGISQALITTMLGLLVAAPILGIYTYLSERTSSMIQVHRRKSFLCTFKELVMFLTELIAKGGPVLYLLFILTFIYFIYCY